MRLALGPHAGIKEGWACRPGDNGAGLSWGAPVASLSAGLPISSSSSLAELRGFIAARGLAVKTAGPGRSKAVIYGDILALMEAASIHGELTEQDSTPEAAAKEDLLTSEVAAAEEATPVEAERGEAAADATKEEAAALAAAAKVTAEVAAPDGFEWGGMF